MNAYEMHQIGIGNQLDKILAAKKEKQFAIAMVIAILAGGITFIFS